MSFPSVWTIRSAPTWIAHASYLRSTGIVKSVVAKQSAQRCNLFCRSWKRLALRTLLCPRLPLLSLWWKLRDRLAETRQRWRTLTTRNAIENLANGLVEIRSRHLGGETTPLFRGSQGCTRSDHWQIAPALKFANTLPGSTRDTPLGIRPAMGSAA